MAGGDITRNRARCSPRGSTQTMTQHLYQLGIPVVPCGRKGRVKDLSPTQFVVGKAKVAVRTGRIRKKFSKDPQKLHDYLRVRPVPVVVRKDRFYLVDHHHLARALRRPSRGTWQGYLHLCQGAGQCQYPGRGVLLENHAQAELDLPVRSLRWPTAAAATANAYQRTSCSTPTAAWHGLSGNIMAT